MGVNRHSHVRISPKIVSTEIDEQAVILQLENSLYYGLNPVATDILIYIREMEPLTVEMIIQRVLEDYDIDRAGCEQDILKLVDEMIEQKLIIELKGSP